MKSGAIAVAIMLLVLLGWARPVPAQGDDFVPELVVPGAPGMTSEAAHLNAAMHRLDALLEAASRDRGIANFQTRNDHARNPIEAATENLDFALDEFLDALEAEADDLTLDDQDLVVEYMFGVADALEDLDVRLEDSGRKSNSGTRDRFITILEDLNGDI